MAYKYKQGECPHPDYSNEVIFGQKTGDVICTGCGEVFAPSEPAYAILKENAAKLSREEAEKRKRR
jgi:ribosomal protein S27E